MRRAAAFVVLGVLVASPASAAGWISCADSAGHASFDYLSGDTAGILTLEALTVSAGEQVWASDVANGPGDPVFTGQQFEDATTIRIDAVDAGSGKVAELRLFKSAEGGSVVRAGTLRIPGLGAWAVACTPT